MGEKFTKRQVSRRDLLKLGSKGAALVAAGALVPEVVSQIAGRFGSAGRASAYGVVPQAAKLAPAYVGAPHQRRLAVTDGYIRLPGKDLYVFGFEDVPFADPTASLDVHKGNTRAPAPLIWVDEGQDVVIKLTNLGFSVRPDLDDAHTIHWHGFRNAYTIFDGVPEVSIAVPVTRDFEYYYQPQDAGTYMYHCHFEDVEHVQMGMTGIIFVRPAQNGGLGLIPAGRYAYNDRVLPSDPASTAYDREWALFLQDIWSLPHDNLASIQESKWTDYDPDYWVINGRCYPDTLLPNNDPSLPAQPVTSLVQCNSGDRVLLRFANLGYQIHSMELAGIPVKIIGHDANYLGRLPSGRANLITTANHFSVAPGESVDVIFTAPDVSSETTFLLKNRNLDRLTNPGISGLGGMATEVHVHPAGTLPVQTEPNT